MPRYLSALHTRTRKRRVRQQILDNLWDEEHGKDNHAELWLRFAEGIGVSRDDVMSATPNDATQALVDTVSPRSPAKRRRGRCRRAVRLRAPGAAGRPARRSTACASTTASTDERTLTFFMVHGVLDIEHSGAEREMLGELAQDTTDAAIEAATAERSRPGGTS